MKFYSVLEILNFVKVKISVIRGKQSINDMLNTKRSSATSENGGERPHLKLERPVFS